ncbi:MAG: GNAT family N-acetyltransferase [Clostridia bacterium]|jgi:ribosomal protein S18 acetylase RimI-like enzyme|nr:GNAT family N-acetyltransferase [Clostridia bacterium]
MEKGKFADYEQEIGLLYLRSDFQGRGIGKELFTLGYNEIKKNKCDKFFISCNKYNIKARGFYEKMGGKLVLEDEDNYNKRVVQAKYHYDVK